MVKSNINISLIRKAIEKEKGKDVNVRVNLGRNKFVKFSGRLSGVYPALFTVVPEDKAFKGKTSYSYSEYMCGKVSLVERN